MNASASVCALNSTHGLPSSSENSARELPASCRLKGFPAFAQPTGREQFLIVAGFVTAACSDSLSLSAGLRQGSGRRDFRELRAAWVRPWADIHRFRGHWNVAPAVGSDRLISGSPARRFVARALAQPRRWG
jgi:hypothetical protein